MPATVTISVDDPIEGYSIPFTFDGNNYTAVIAGNTAVRVLSDAELGSTIAGTIEATIVETGQVYPHVVHDSDGPAVTCTGAFNKAKAEQEFELWNPSKTQQLLLSEIDSQEVFKIKVPVVDCNGVYIGDSTEGGSVISGAITGGNEDFDIREGIYNWYDVTAPSTLVDTSVVFSVGKYDDVGDTIENKAEITIPIIAGTATGGGGTLPDLGPLRAAPFVEGHGQDAVGGRNDAIQVAHNEDEFAAFWRGSAPGRILLDFSGDIEQATRMYQGGPHKTVYGQTARGEGVQIMRPTSEDRTGLSVTYSETVLQHLRHRAGKETTNGDFIRAINVNAAGDRAIVNFVSYHSSYSWATDQATSIWYNTRNLLFWRDLYAEPLNHNGHGYNWLSGSSARDITVARCYFGQGAIRNPQVEANVDGANFQLINNVISGYGRGMFLRSRTGGITGNYNIEGNLFQRGPDSSVTWEEIECGETAGLLSVYLNENYYLNNGETLASNPGALKAARTSDYLTGGAIRSGILQGSPHTMPSVSLIPVVNLNSEVVDKAGALPARRDATDARIMSNYATNAGYVNNEDRRVLASGPTRIDDSRADKTHAAFRSQYGIDDATNCLITPDGNGEGWTLFEQYMYWQEQQVA